MTAYARVITIGRNADIPKVVHLPFGVGVDGAVIKYPVTIRGDEIICPACKGWGVDDWNDRCERCTGDGIVEIEQETSADTWCLPAAEVGRPVYRPAGRPPSSGMTPAALGAGVQPHVQKTEAPTVLRMGVPKSSSASCPAGDMPPNALPGTFLDQMVDGLTVVSGLAMFCMIAMFFMVIA